ncbi:MAG: hypothetical protein ACK51F_10660 [Rhodospirillales bacterium]|jgi:hypothetical protein
MNLAERWLRNAWALTWGLIVLATALLTVAMIDSSAWLQVITLASTGFYAIRAIETFKGTTP